MKFKQTSPTADRRGGALPVLLPLVLLWGVTASSGWAAVGLAVFALIWLAGREPLALAARRKGLLPAAVVLYSLLYLASGLWSHFGAYARLESVKTLAALSVFGLLVFRLCAGSFRRLLWSLDGVLALVGLLCIDASSLKLLSRGYCALVGLVGVDLDPAAIGYETGVRITGIFANANVSAGVLAFGLILSLYLVQTAEDPRRELLAGLLLGAEALAFLLSFSMGAMAAFAVTCLVYLLCAGKGRRVGLCLLMVESVVITLLCAFAAYPMLGKDGNPVPLLLALVCGPAVVLLDRFVGRKLAAALAQRGKLLALAAGGLAGLAVVYAVLAMNVTGGVTLDGSTALRRAVALAPGDYTVTQAAGGSVEIYSQDESQLMMHTQTDLYSGDLPSAAFTVPEDSRVVWFVLSGDVQLDRVTLSDGTELPLGYRLLPGFAANRLQALWANQNFIQRLVFFRDGLTLWSQKPLLGWGAGGVEGQLTAVQSFYYESKYIHNHFIQIMDEAGVVGLAAFVLVLGSAVALLVRRRREERTPEFAMLAACLTMMIGHSLTEVVWSTQAYQVVVFTLLAALVLRYGEQETVPVKGAAPAKAVYALLLVTAAVFALLQAGSLWAAHSYANLTGIDTPAAFQKAMGKLDAMDVYDDTAYKANRMANALQSGDRSVAARCAYDLMAKEEFDACYYAAAYYYLPLDQLSDFFAALKTGLRQEASNPQAWNSAFSLAGQAVSQLSADDMDDYLSGLCGLGDALDRNNQGRMAPIALEENAQALLDAARSAKDQGLSGADVLEVLQAAAQF